MSEGIVCKVWNIKGNVNKKTASAQLNDSLSYILNDEKTTYKMDFQDDFFSDPEGQLSRECKYIENDIKTIDGALVGTHNLFSGNIRDAVSEMMETKKFYQKLDGRAALHMMISLPVEESDIGNASKLMQLCNDVIKELFPDHQAVYAVHTNTDNLHIHCIVNSVGLNGKKIHQPKNFMKDVVQPCVNKFAEKYGFTPNDKWNRNKKNKSENTDESGSPNSSFIDNKIYLRQCIDRAIENSSTFDDFVRELKTMGLYVRVGKYLSLSTDKMEKPIRSHRLGSNYTIDSIIERIENRLSRFEVPNVNGKTYGKKIDDILSPDTVPLKKYKSMSPEEKKKVLKILRLGRNPWRENQQANWQLNKIANELNIEYRLSEYKKFYSADGTVSGTLEGISSVQETLSKAKKELRATLQKNKPVIDIYHRMKELERKAYLYEHMDRQEFRTEFVEYRSLSVRLERGYGKTIFDVASFIKECEDRIVYCDGQLKELSEEYKEVRKYALKHGYVLKTEYSLSDAIGLFDNQEAERSGFLESDMFYVSSKETDCIVRVEKSPGFDSRGNVIEEYSIVFLSKYGEELERVNNLNGKKELNSRLYELGDKYGFGRDCKRFSSLYMAKDYSGINSESSKKDFTENKSDDSPRANSAQGSSQDIKTYSFTQALNLNSVKKKEGNHLIMNRENPVYMGSLMTNGDYIRFTVLNRSGRIEEVFTLPSLGKRNADGYKILTAIREKYGFSDDLVSFEDQEEAFNYYRDKEEKEDRREEEASKKKGSVA